jgi:hypothetical protein
VYQQKFSGQNGQKYFHMVLGKCSLYLKKVPINDSRSLMKDSRLLWKHKPPSSLSPLPQVGLKYQNPIVLDNFLPIPRVILWFHVAKIAEVCSELAYFYSIIHICQHPVVFLTAAYWMRFFPRTTVDYDTRKWEDPEVKKPSSWSKSCTWPRGFRNRLKLSTQNSNDTEALQSKGNHYSQFICI